MAHSHAIAAERFAGTPKLPLRAAALSAAGLALVLGHGTTLLEESHQPTEPDILTHEHPGDQAVFVLPGCRTDGHRIADLLEPQLSQLGTTIYTAYPAHGFPLKDIGRKLVREREKAGKEKVSVYAISMGGLVLSALGTDESFRREFGPIDKLVLDSSPASGSDVLPKMQHLLTAAQLARYSYMAGKLVPFAIKHAGKKEWEHEDGLDDTLVRQHFMATAHTHLYTIASQGHFIRQHGNITPGTLAGWVNEISYVHAAHDPVINTETGVRAYEAIYGQPIRDISDGLRPLTSHAAGPEYPSRIAALLAGPALMREAA